MKQALSWSPEHSPSLPSTLPRSSRTGALAGQSWGAELWTDSTHTRWSSHRPPGQALCPGPQPTDLLDRGLSPAGGEAAQDAALRHLQPRGHGRDAGQHGGQARHVGLHVTQQLLELVQHCKEHPRALSHAPQHPLPRGAAGSKAAPGLEPLTRSPAGSRLAPRRAAYPCAGRHLQACSQRGTLWRDAGGSQQGTPLQPDGRSMPWPGDWGLESC